jgi:uracil-DNA glycosylase family 4
MTFASDTPASLAPEPLAPIEPSRDCPLCPRLVAAREALRADNPTWWNAPVPAFGDPHAWLAIVGLAPGLHGANRTGRPFTGDHSGALLFATLGKLDLATGTYANRANDDVAPVGVMILNAVKCVPPANKPTSEEIRTCRTFLDNEIAALPNLQVVVALGQVAHQSAVKVMGGRLPKATFAHLAEHRMPDGRVLIDSYHPSRYNQNTGRIDEEAFEAVFARALELRQIS